MCCAQPAAQRGGFARALFQPCGSMRKFMQKSFEKRPKTSPGAVREGSEGQEFTQGCPRWPKRGPRGAQERPKSAQERPKIAPRAPQECPRASQDRPKSAPRAPKRAPRATKRRPREVQGVPKRGPRGFKKGPKCVSRGNPARHRKTIFLKVCPLKL